MSVEPITNVAAFVDGWLDIELEDGAQPNRESLLKLRAAIAPYLLVQSAQMQALREVAGDHLAILPGDQIPTCAFCSADEGADHEAECTMNVVLAAIDQAEGREPKAGYVVGEDAAVRS